MQRTFIFLLLGLACIFARGQNTLSLHVGFLGTNTSIAEYERINRLDHLLDSMSLNTTVGSLQATMNVDIDLGKNFYLATGFHYSKKGLEQVTFTDSTGWDWKTEARQYYAGLSLLLGYKIRLRESKFGLQFATGLKSDFAVGTPNAGTLFSGPYYRFFLPFSQYNEVDLSWMTEAGVSYALGPGDLILRCSYQYGLSDVMEDPWVVGRSMSAGITVGYAFRLAQR